MSKNAFANLLNAVNKAKQGAVAQDPHADKFWKAETDKAGNGFAVIRFLPGKTEDEIPFVKTYSHGFQGPGGKWYIENCPTTIEGKCPVCDDNSVHWNKGEEGQKFVRGRKSKRRLSYISNVLVISDPTNPENEGQVRLFKYGAKIFDKLVDKLQPDPADKTAIPVNIFDLKEGANFKLKIRRVEGFANFDKSEFDSVSEVEKSDAVMASLHDLQVFIAKDQYKDYDVLEQKLKLVLGGAAGSTKKAEDVNTDKGFAKAHAAAQTKPAAEAPAKPAAPAAEPEGEEPGDDLDYFRNLAKS
jgi:hypothetical protein